MSLPPANPPSAPAPPGQPARGTARRWTWVVLAFAFLFVLMPFWFWQSTWFGRPLDDEKMADYLADREKPRHTQHALAQIAERIVAGDASVRRWYPDVVALAAHPVDEIRTTVAWVMGQDNTAGEFRDALLGLLSDPDPMVRRNAALSLVRFADSSGRREIRAMLEPFHQRAPGAGKLRQRLRPGDAVNPGTLVARIEQREGEEPLEVRSEVPGTLQRWLVGDGREVFRGEELAAIQPSAEVVWEALRALHLIGTPAELPAVERYAAGLAGMPDRVAQQAAETAQAIRARE